MFSIFLLVISFRFLAIHGALQPLVPSETYTNFIVVDQTKPTQYQLHWKLTSINEIQFELHAQTTGWVGMGISPDGGMTGSLIKLTVLKNFY